MRQTYPREVTTNLPHMHNVLSQILQIRDEDLSDYDNLKNVFIRGRKVDKVPTSSADTTGDNVGDFNYSTTYLYVCVNNGGALAWRRVALSSW